MDGSGSLAAALGIDPFGYEPVEVVPGLHAMQMRTDRSLQEYLRIHLRIPLVPDIRQLSSVFDFVADAAPGVKEVLAVGKVCWEVKEERFDVVIVDAEATGHVVAQISSPRTINSLVPRGPLRDQTGWMLAILDDPATCGVVVVATPEELPVTESLELAERLDRETKSKVAAFVVNMAEPPVPDGAAVLAADEWFAKAAPAHAASVRRAEVLHAAQEEAIVPLRGSGNRVITLPAVVGNETQVARNLAALLSAEAR